MPAAFDTLSIIVPPFVYNVREFWNARSVHAGRAGCENALIPQSSGQEDLQSMPDDRKPDDEKIRPPKELEAAWKRHPQIVKLGHPALRQVAKPLTRYSQQTHELIERMTAVMRDANGLGLAAPQVGVSTRLLVYDAGNDHGLQ